MSILINGMEMPKNCDECPLLTEDGDYDVCFIGKKRVMWDWKHDKVSEVIHPKPDWCPLDEVPPHGRLIDLDETALAQYYDEEHEEWSMKTVTVEDILYGVCENMPPIVIPADKDGGT